MEKRRDLYLVLRDRYVSRGCDGVSSRLDWQKRNVYRLTVVMVSKPLGKHLFERPKKGWQDNIKVDVTMIGCKNRRFDRTG
jgi:hypothetical protein